jgi:SAM-dependent methyltransferase
MSLKEQALPLLKRADARIPWALVYRGDAVECPCCRGRFRAFRSYHGRKNARCPACSSLERHRTLWLYLQRRTDVLSRAARILHMAPEPAIERQLRRLPSASYTAADLHPARPEIVRADITGLPFDDGSFDLVLCNHVLEHIPDDGAAMRELHRVLTDDGIAIMQHPIDENRATTYEDPSIVTPQARKRAFGQEDHARIYGRDFRERLSAAGFQVTVERYADELDAGEVQRYALAEHGGLYRGSDIHLAAKAAAV